MSEGMLHKDLNAVPPGTVKPLDKMILGEAEKMDLNEVKDLYCEFQNSKSKKLHTTKN